MRKPNVFIEIDGLKFYRDATTGYYVNGSIKMLAHRYVWSRDNGPIPPGWHVHHKDRDRAHNDPSNLDCMSSEDHKALHIREDFTFERRAQRARFFRKNVQGPARAWHKSPEGRAWHRQHAIDMAKSRKPHAFVCANCAAGFTAISTGKNAFCSNACKSAHRRSSGVDNESRPCEACGDQFVVSKFSRSRCCGKSCANRLRGSFASMMAAVERDSSTGKFRKVNEA